MKTLPILENHDTLKQIGTVWMDDEPGNNVLHVEFQKDKLISKEAFLKMWNCPIVIDDCETIDDTIYIRSARIYYFNYENRPPITFPTA